MTHVQNISKTIYMYRIIAMRALGLGILALFVVYGYFIVGIIFNGSAIEHVQQNISSESSDLGDLESRYITLKNSISRDEAYALGFVEVENPIYISRASANAVALQR